MPEIITLPEVDSTNNFLKNNKEFWKKKFLTVRAIRQTKGRGRLTKEWLSTEKDLTFSFVYLPQTPITENIPFITLYTGLAIYRVLMKIVEKDLYIKWPNDIYYKDSKLAGILTELVMNNENKIIIVGIGINVNSKNDTIDNRPVTSLFNILKTPVHIENLLLDLMDEIEMTLANISAPLTRKFKTEWMNSINNNILYQQYNGSSFIQFKITGLTDLGELIVDVDGTRQIIRDGEINLLSR